MDNGLKDLTTMLAHLSRVQQSLLGSFARNLFLLECETVSVSFVAFMQNLNRNPSTRALKIGTRVLQQWKPR